jgi:hypothetical protein
MATPVLIGEATLDQDVLVDSLVTDVIDGLRDELHPQFGVRAYRVYRVIRTWTGRLAGEGQATDVAAELRPQPRVMVWDGLRYAQAICGIRELGEVRLSEVSLSYTEAQLTGQPLGKNQECYLAIAEGNGQASTTRLYGHTAPPFVDREKTLGWLVYLRCVDGVPAWRP